MDKATRFVMCCQVSVSESFIFTILALIIIQVLSVFQVVICLHLLLDISRLTSASTKETSGWFPVKTMHKLDLWYSNSYAILVIQCTCTF